MRAVEITITAVPPSVVMTAAAPDTAERTFRLDVEFMGAMPALTAFDATMLEATDSGDSDVTLTVEDQRFNAANQTYVALLKYNLLAELPLTVTTVDSFMTADTPKATATVAVPDVPEAPGAPTIGTATADQAANTVTVTWTAPADDGGSAITGYTITQSGQAAMTYTAAATATSHTTGALAAGDYSFTVMATNSVGDSAASAAAMATIDADPVHPSVAMTVSNLDEAARTFKLEVAFTGAMPAVAAFDASMLSATDSGDADVTLTVEDQQFNATNQMYVGLLKYNPLAVLPLTVTTADSFMTSDTPKASAMVEAPPAPTAPGAPTIGTATADQTANTITVSWTAPADDGNSAITGYTVTKHYMMNGTAATKDFSATASPLTIPPAGSGDMLPQGVSFTFTVKATNSVGTGPASAASNAVMINVDPTAPGAPTIGTATADQAANTITVSWTAPAADGGSAITGYTITQSGQADASYPATASPFTTPALAAGDYSFTVMATNAIGNSAASAAATATIDADPPVVVPAPPAAPTNLTATPGNAQVTLKWTMSTDTTITGYEYSMDGTAWVDIPGSDATTATYIVTGLTNGTAYTFHLRAVNSEGDGAVSTATPVTPMAPLVAPGPVTNLTATVGDEQVVLSWTAPTTGDIDSYEFSMNSGLSWLPIVGSNATTTTYTVTGLINGQGYNFVVRAINSAHKGPASNEITRTPVEAPPSAPAAPAGLTAVATANVHGSVTLTWTVVTGATYEYSTDGTTWMDATSPQAVTGLTGGTLYTFSVRVKAAGNVPAGMIATATATPTSAPIITPVTIDLAAKGYLVIVGAGFSANTLPGVTPTEVAGFPSDLAAFLIAGGTIDVAATGGDVIINEFMVARDAIKIGNGDPTDGQWIELYNKHATDAATGITVTFSSARPAPAHPANFQDRLSNVVGQGWNFQGTFGAEVITGSSNREARVNFISIRRSQPGKDGWVAGHWQKTPETLVFAEGRVGTPGKVNSPTVFTPVPNDRPAKSVIISEVANRMDDSKEWIELKGPAGKSLKNWKLSIATATGTETNIFTFPNNDNIKISANGHLLLTDVDPLNGELAADYANGVPAPNRYKNGVVTLGALPNDGNFVLILRSDKGKTNHEAIQDIAGHVGAALQRANPYATLWPLRGNAGVISSHNKLAGGKVYRRARENIDGYSATAGNKLHESAFAAVGFTGLGYDRNAPVTAENGGTPGYPHGAYKGDGADAPGNVIISEIMYAISNGGTTRNRSLPQWIEIHNTSDVNGVNLSNWRLDIVNSGENADGSQYAGKFSENIGLSGTIPPNQTYLIAARRLGVNQNTRLPTERIRNVGKKFNEELLNPNGFHLTLKAKTHKGANEHVIVDTVGNLNDPAAGDRRADARSFAGNAWELEHAVSEDGSRISIARRTSPKLNAKGTDQAAWVLSSEDNRYSGIIQLTYYGRSDDQATPGYTIGGALPVSLSKFRPERLATGEVVVRWVTESETNNAGFNILRSDTRDGEFTKLNTKLIAGQGTTSERTAYEFTDTSAKPNVFYYYQIQDVSFDGEVATLRTTHVRGNVTPAGKITTTWGELKALQ